MKEIMEFLLFEDQLGPVLLCCVQNNFTWAWTLQAKFGKNSKQGYSDLQGFISMFFSFAMFLLLSYVSPPSLSM